MSTRLASKRRSCGIPRRQLGWGSLLVAALALLAACAGSRDDTGSWVTSAETAHHEADRLLAAGDAHGARDVLQRLETTMPGDANGATRAVHADLLYRVAELDLRENDVKGAVDSATRGLELGRSNDAFTTNLLIVRGRAHEKLGDAVAASRDYHDALVITEALLDRSLEGNSP